MIIALEFVLSEDTYSLSATKLENSSDSALKSIISIRKILQCNEIVASLETCSVYVVKLNLRNFKTFYLRLRFCVYSTLESQLVPIWTKLTIPHNWLCLGMKIQIDIIGQEVKKIITLDCIGLSAQKSRPKWVLKKQWVNYAYAYSDS